MRKWEERKWKEKGWVSRGLTLTPEKVKVQAGDGEQGEFSSCSNLFRQIHLLSFSTDLLERAAALRSRALFSPLTEARQRLLKEASDLIFDCTFLSFSSSRTSLTAFPRRKQSTTRPRSLRTSSISPVNTFLIASLESLSAFALLSH